MKRIVSTSLAAVSSQTPCRAIDSLYFESRAVHSVDALLIKSNQPKGKATPQATGNRIRTGNGTKKSLVKSDSPERENAKAKNLESETARPASTGNRTRKSLIESETQDSKTKKHEGKRPEGPGETGP
ncbi:hypothetical protein ABZX72_17835, partial [Streptomyces cyaneofuscatus]|uniref:hypothetical protein n=1 Tax=Streptomyces cyaneofuscatus TaxID=66883 RepID=UPI0033AB3FDA